MSSIYEITKKTHPLVGKKIKFVGKTKEINCLGQEEEFDDYAGLHDCTVLGEQAEGALVISCFWKNDTTPSLTLAYEDRVKEI